MKLLVIISLVLSATATGAGLWAVGETRYQQCLLRALEVTNAGQGGAWDTVVNPDGTKPLKLHAVFPTGRSCERWPF